VIWVTVVRFVGICFLGRVEYWACGYVLTRNVAWQGPVRIKEALAWMGTRPGGGRFSA
jgi:hypothetical protein